MDDRYDDLMHDALMPYVRNLQIIDPDFMADDMIHQTLTDGSMTTIFSNLVEHLALKCKMGDTSNFEDIFHFIECHIESRSTIENDIQVIFLEGISTLLYHDSWLNEKWKLNEKQKRNLHRFFGDRTRLCLEDYI